jgi:hypothetical protein
MKVDTLYEEEQSSQTLMCDMYSDKLERIGSIHVSWNDGRPNERMVAIGAKGCRTVIAVCAAIPINDATVVLVTERLGSINVINGK